MMFFKNRTVHSNPYPQQLAFNSVINNIANIIEKAENLDEKIGNLDYFISVITADLCTDVGSRFIYKGHGEVIYFDIPMGSTDENGVAFSIDSKEIITVNIADVNVYSSPTELNKIYKTLKRKNVLINIDCIDNSVYYPDINLLECRNNSNHTLHLMKYWNAGTVKTKVSNIHKLYPYVTTDGKKWIHKYRDKQYDVSDFRTAVLYELSKMRYELLSDTR